MAKWFRRLGRTRDTCQMCKKYLLSDFFLMGIHPGALTLVDRDDIKVCMKCAKREAGSKHWKRELYNE